MQSIANYKFLYRRAGACSRQDFHHMVKILSPEGRTSVRFLPDGKGLLLLWRKSPGGSKPPPYIAGEFVIMNYFGIVMVSTISASVSLRSDTAPIPAAWIRERDWVRLLRNPPRLTREGGFFS